jgi:hypothetical protein
MNLSHGSLSKIAIIFPLAATGFLFCAVPPSPLQAPPILEYPQKEYAVSAKTAINPIIPRISGSDKPVERVNVNKALPIGLSIDEVSGTISGTPDSAMAREEYAISATNSYGTGKADTFYLTVLPAIPNGIRIPTMTITDTSVSLSWNQDNSVDSFKIYRSSNSHTTFDSVATIAGYEFTDRGLAPGDTLRYFLKSYKNGIGSSLSSDTIVVFLKQPVLDTILVTISGTGGSVSPSGMQKLSPGSNLTITITPDIGNHVDSVIVDGVIDTAAISSKLVFLKNISANHTVRVRFAKNTYSVNVTASNGTVTQSPPNKTTFLYGDTVRLIARANTGYYFGGWAGDTSGSDSSINITVCKNRAITANFVPLGSLALNIATDTSKAIVTKSPDSVFYHYGTQITLTATPKTGYNFVKWSGLSDSLSNPAIITITTTTSAIAVVAKKSYQLTVTSGAGGVLVTPSTSPITVLHDSAIAISVQATAGYTFSKWSVISGMAQFADSSSPTTTVRVTAPNTSIQANLLKKKFTLAFLCNPQNGGSVIDSMVVDSGVQVPISCSAANNFSFTSWSVTSGIAVITNTAASSTYAKLSTNATLTANFLQLAGPVIDINPVSLSTKFIGDTIVLKVAAHGSPAPTYQWYKNDTLLLRAYPKTPATLQVI